MTTPDTKAEYTALRDEPAMPAGVNGHLPIVPIAEFKRREGESSKAYAARLTQMKNRIVAMRNSKYRESQAADKKHMAELYEGTEPANPLIGFERGHPQSDAMSQLIEELDDNIDSLENPDAFRNLPKGLQDQMLDAGDSDARPVMNATVSQAVGNNPQFIDSLGKLRRVLAAGDPK